MDVQTQLPPSFKRKSSLECTCINRRLSDSKSKIFTVCDICSERRFLKKSSIPIIHSDPESFSDE